MDKKRKKKIQDFSWHVGLMLFKFDIGWRIAQVAPFAGGHFTFDWASSWVCSWLWVIFGFSSADDDKAFGRLQKEIQIDEFQNFVRLRIFKDW